MTAYIKLNPHDFEHLTKGDQEYLESIEKLYLLNSGRLDHFRSVGPWHMVDAKYLDKVVERLASPTPRPCSRGHVKGLWCVQDPNYLTGPIILKRKSTGSESDRSSTSRTESSRPSTFRGKGKGKSPRLIPRPQVPQATPAWIILDPKRTRLTINDDMSEASVSSPTQTPRPDTAATSSSRYVASPYETLSPEELDDIISRVTRPTVASRGGVDIREKFMNTDYVYGSKSVTPEELNDAIKTRLTKPTVASRGGVDIAEKFENKDYVYGSRSVTPAEFNEIVERMTKPTVASTGGAGKERTYTDFVYGEEKVSSGELDDIINRVTKPTVSSTGAVDLRNKKFEYISPARVKTNIIIPGLEKRYLGKKKMTQQQITESAERLNKLTKAYKAKYSINPHVWKDTSMRTGPAHQREAMKAA